MLPARLQCAVFLILGIGGFLSGCTSLSTSEWRPVAEEGPVRVFYRAQADSAIPRFKGVVQIDASPSDIMKVLTDFQRYPEWVHLCERADIVKFVSYSEAYVYQVTALPLVTDRDMILHGKILPDDGEYHSRIQLRAVPDYCNQRDLETCRAIQDSNYVRVTQARGEFQLRRLSGGKVEVSWQQSLDPGGWIPAWAVRLMLADVPSKSLNNLKQRVEKQTK